ncbi:MAG: hypothetical protein AABZ44_09315 [Elusimicrobiota bacterium]
MDKHALTVILLCGYALTVHGAADDMASLAYISKEKVAQTPKELLALSLEIENDLGILRFEMGRASAGPSAVKANGVNPREAAYIAAALSEKSSRLAAENGSSSKRTDRAVATTPVGTSLATALQNIREVKKKLQASKAMTPSPMPAAASWDDVFASLYRCSTQLDLLLDRQYSSTDEFQAITTAVHHTARLLAAFPGAQRIPPEPDYVAGKSAADIMDTLVFCFTQLSMIARGAGLPMMEITANPEHQETQKGEVFNLTNLIVAELAFMHEQTGASKPAQPVADTSSKLPAHVFQRSGLFKLQLLELMENAAANRAWLSKPKTGG